MPPKMRVEVAQPLSRLKAKLSPSFSLARFRLKKKLSYKLSLGEYGRQRTSKKFHDLVLNLRFQNSRVPVTIMFQALFSQRKVSVDACISNNH